MPEKHHEKRVFKFPGKGKMGGMDFNFDFDVDELKAHGPHKAYKFKVGGDGCCSPNSGGGAKQVVEDDRLVVLLSLPGIDKSTLKVRAKTDTLIVSADTAEHLVKYLGKKKIEKRVSLHESVISESAKAKYTDGYLQINFTLADPGDTVEIIE